MRRTKIVCTIGPASSDTAELDRLVAAGLDVARLNFSHGTHDEHAEVIRRIREGEARWGRPIAILQDLQGPKIRLGTFGAGDIDEVRACLLEEGADLPIVAKRERHEIVDNLPGILSKVDAVMVARGDLGVDVPLEDVPHIQKEIIRQARGAKVPVIVATQMLESMVTHLRPTRAEVSDVSTAIFDGADAIMLSAETATGRYPAEAVAVMARIAERADGAVLTIDRERRRRPSASFPEAISDAAATAAQALDARAIVAFTESGFSARLISQARPSVPIIALTPFVEVRRRLALSWGVASRLIRKVETTDEMIEEVEATLLGDGAVRANDVIVIISGSPMWVRGTTNLLKLHRVGERRT